MTGNISYMSEYEPYDGGYVSFGHGRGKITGKGIIKTGKLEFENVYFVKELKYNMFSVSQICDNKNSVLFTDSECLVMGKDFKLDDDTHVLLRTTRQQNMYSIDLKNIVPHKNLTCLIAKASEDESMLWHRRLGHLNFKTMNKLVRNNLVKGLPSKSFENIHTCVACLKGKQHKASCKTKLVSSITKPLHTLHMDLFGPTSVSSLNHKWYCLVVTDDFSRFTWTFFLKSKDETSSILRNFITEIENLKDLKVKIIRCDNGGEFRNKEMDEFCTRKGIKREFSNARTPQQNGVAERRNRTLIEAARTMLADAKLPVTFWAEAVNTACYVQNRVLVNKSQNKTPYELFNGRSPAIGFLRPFGCHVMILNTLDHLGKFDAKGDEEVANQTMEENVSTLRFIALPKWFHKAQMETSIDSSKKNDDSQKEQDRIISNSDAPKSSGNSNPTATAKDLTTDQVEPILSSTVETKVPTVSLLVPIDCLSIPPIIGPVDTHIQTRQKTKNMEEQSFIAIIHQKTNLKLLQYCLFSCFLSQEEPKKIFDALKDPSWVEAMQEELLQFKIQNVWVLVDCPKGVRPIGTKWVLKNKRDERGIVIRNKARLVAQGYTQEEGIDYEEVFAPVARIEAIRLFLAYASYMGFTVYQMDVKSAFLYETIDDEVYVMQPPRFQDSQFPDRVLQDDIIFGSSNPKLCREFENLMHDKFKMSAMGELNFFLGLQVLQKKDGIFLSQDKYVVDILKKFRLSDVRSANTPMDREHPWGKNRTGKNVELHLYRSMIGSLMYLTASRPDIVFAVCACARHQVTPKESHLHAVKIIFRYLKGYPKLGLWYPKESPFDLVAYSDSDYGGASQDRKSTTRGCQFLGRRLISWQCKKQTIMATSTTKAEYVAAASGCGQVLWIQNQLLDYGYNFMNTKIYIDNNSAICIVKNPVYHSRKKHIEIRHHFIRDCYEKKLINVDHVHSDDNIADLLTKAFDVGRFQLVIVDFLEASHIRYALMVHPTVNVAHIQQFWSTARVKIVDEATKIIATINGMQRTLTISSIRRHLKLNDAEDETASPLGDDKHGEAFPTTTSFDAGQDRENIAKTSAMSHEASPRVTSLGGGEGKERRRCSGGCSKHGGIDQGEDLLEDDNEKDSNKSADKGSESTGEMANVLSTLEAANILASGGSKSVFTTTSSIIATASTCVSPAVATASGSFPTAAVFTTASVATPRVTRSSRGIVIEPSSPISVNIPSISKKDKGKGIMTEPKKPKDQRIRKLAERDSEIVRIHSQEELDMMIAELDGSNEMVAKHLSEYEQAEAELSHNEKVELINELLKYQRDLAQIKKYQAQQSKLTTKTERRKFYTSVLRSSASWKAKYFKGMTFNQIEEKFFPVWEKIQEFVPMDSKLESERLKRPGIQLTQKSSKKSKTAKASGSELSQEQQTKEPKELYEEELKKMMEIVPTEEVYIEALQIVRVGDHTEVYQLFEEMLRNFNRKDLDKLWSLVKETFSSTDPTEDKEKMLWVELKRLYEPDPRDQLWAL
ncbi:putative ribonuclease H-like domain-containing protein [Tanacetum coccineum]